MAQPQYTPVLPIETLIPYIDASGDCWEWTGVLEGHQYGTLRVEVDGVRVKRRAHRLVWVALCGPIPGNLPLDHLCRVKRCVNPDHLEPVTDRINVLRGHGPSAQAARRAFCQRGHQNWGVIQSTGVRSCRTCINQRDRENRKEQAAVRAPSTHCRRGHERTPENTTRSGYGVRCITCFAASKFGGQETYHETFKTSGIRRVTGEAPDVAIDQRETRP